METFANWRQAKQYIFIGEKDVKKNGKKMFARICIYTHSCCANKHFADIIMFYICKLCVSKSWEYYILVCPIVLHEHISFSNMYLFIGSLRICYPVILV